MAMYLVQVATLQNTEEIARLVNSAYRGDSSRQGWTSEADYLDGQRTDATALMETLRDPRQTILLLREQENGPLIGCVNLERTDSGDCYLGMLTVSPTKQAGGIGRFLMEYAEDFARKNFGSRTVTLGVIQIRDSLIAWYERRGYKKTGETKPFPYGDEIFGKPRRNDLFFVLMEKSIGT